MKKIICSVLLLLIAHTAFSKKNEFSRWSVAVDAGLNRFDGDISQSVKQIFPTSFTKTTGGLTVEYALTPVWGLSTQYYYFPLSGKGSIGEFTTDLHTVSFNATANFSRIVNNESRSKGCVYISMGLGFASYVSLLNQPPAEEKKSPVCNAGSIPISISYEYNVSRPISLIAKVNYMFFTKDNLEGIAYKGVTNDAIASVVLGMRWKINSLKKDHLRNISVEDYSPNKAMLLGLENAQKINKLDTSLRKLDKRVGKVEHRLDSLEVLISNDGPDSDGDGVPDHRDLASNTPANTPVDFWGRPLNIVTKTEVVKSYYSETPSVYFNFDQSDLDKLALIAISKVAKVMIENPEVLVEVRGYTDYSGANPYNMVLSQKRADRVKAELVKIWKINPNRIIANGKGRVLEPQIKYAPSRRCDFFFDKDGLLKK